MFTHWCWYMDVQGRGVGREEIVGEGGGEVVEKCWGVS